MTSSCLDFIQILSFLIITGHPLAMANSLLATTSTTKLISESQKMSSTVSDTIKTETKPSTTGMFTIESLLFHNRHTVFVHFFEKGSPLTYISTLKKVAITQAAISSIATKRIAIISIISIIELSLSSLHCFIYHRHSRSTCFQGQKDQIDFKGHSNHRFLFRDNFDSQFNISSFN